MDDMTMSNTNFSNSTEFVDWMVSLLVDVYLRLEMPHFDTITKNLTNLQRLHLNHVSINSVLPQTLANLSSLTSLQLNFCYLRGVFPSNILRLPHLYSLMANYNPNLYIVTTAFKNMSSSLEVVDFSNTSLSGNLPEYSPGSNPPQLRKFLAYLCSLSGTIPSWVWNTTEEVALDGNHLIGELPSAMNTEKLSHFTTLSLQGNFLKGAIPLWLWTLPSLVTLNLGDNKFSGELDGSSLTGNSSLGLLDLSMNYLSVQIHSFSRFKHLFALDLSNNILFFTGDVNSSISWPKLSSLKLSSCNISAFPDFLRFQQSLRALDLSNNGIQGDIPSWFKDVGKNSLMLLNISHNNLTGGLELLSWENLMYIDIRSNSLQGFLPVPPPYTSMFLASNNRFHGKIPSSFCYITLLGLLDLSYNQLSGKIPKCLGNPSSLSILNFRSNKLHGKIAMNFTEYCNLQSIDLNDNQFEGKVPRSLRRCESLQLIDLGRNRLNDTFPHWLGTLPQLKVLVLHSNNFQGPIKYSPKANKNPFPKLQILDLSENQFCGKLPMRYIEKFRAMMVNNDSGHNYSNHYMGNFADYYHDSVVLTVKGLTMNFARILTIFTTLDVSNNRFTGDIPDSVGQLAALVGLNISHNHLTGHIPPSFIDLTSLEFLDLSCNRLVGEIPPELVSLTFLEAFNVSENLLVGQIPKGNQFNTFLSNSYEGNLGLCGYPLPECKRGGSLDHSPTPQVSQHEESDFFDIIISISLWKIIMMGFGIGTILGFVAGGCMLFTVKPVWFSRKVDRMEYIMVQSFKKHSRRRQMRT